MSFSSPIYGDYNGIFLIFIRVTLQNLWTPVRNRSGIFHFEKSAVFRTLQLLRTEPHKSCSRNARCECNTGRSGDLRSGLTRDYSKKLSSKETTLFDEGNQAFFTADCGCLQVPFTSPHSLSVYKRKQRHRSWKNYTHSERGTAAQSSQYTVHYANGQN